MRDHHAVGWCTTLLAAAALALSACSFASDSLSHTSSTAATASNTTIASSAPTSPSPPSALTAPSPASVSAEIPLETPPDPATSAPASTEPVEPASEQPVPDAPGAAETGPAVSGFAGSVNSIDEATASRMSTSWRPGCPVALSDLRYLTVTYRGFDGADHQGELVVAASVASDVLDIFGALYGADYPIASLRLVDDFGGSDDDSMAANNSSAFNCRPVTGGGGFSEHSYGTAIDLNPIQNPYLSGSRVLPAQGRDFVDRRSAPGVIEPDDAVVSAFAERGWSWGGNWNGPVDYQHFSVSGR